MRRLLATVAAWVTVVGLLSGCAGLNRPYTYVYPMAGQSLEQQVTDYDTCERWAREQTGYDAAGAATAGAVRGVVIGATIGAILGAIICAPVNAAGSCAAFGAAVGGASGGMQGAATNVDAGRLAFTRAFEVCALARGYAAGGLVMISAPPPPPPPPPPPGPVDRRPFGLAPIPEPEPAWDAGL